MSWDIFVQQIPSGAGSVGDIPDGFVPGPFGSRDSIIAAIQRVVPGADFRDPSWGKLDGPGYSIEVNLGEAREVTGFVLHVFAGELSVHVVTDILQALGLRALDPSSRSGLFEPASAAADFSRWREYRDQLVRRGSN